VMAALLLAAVVFELILTVYGPALGRAMGALGFLIGMVAMTVYPIALSHANDRAVAERSFAIASGVLFFYCVGAVAGPITAVAMMERFGPQALFLFMALIHGAVLVVTVLRILQRSPAENRIQAEPGLPP
jgi:MFS family permease